MELVRCQRGPGDALNEIKVFVSFYSNFITETGIEGSRSEESNLPPDLVSIQSAKPF